MTAKPKTTLAARGDQILTPDQLDQPIQKMLIGKSGAPISAWKSLSSGTTFVLPSLTALASLCLKRLYTGHTGGI